MVKESSLSAGEHVLFTAHSHWKNILGPVLLTVLLLGAAGAAVVLLSPDPLDVAWKRWAVAGLAVVLSLVLGLRPFLGWITSTDTLTSRRLISRRGILSRAGKDIPIDRVMSVSYRQSLVDRFLGCGTLVVQTAGDNSDVELYDVAHIEKRLLQIQQLILDEDPPSEDRTGAGPADR